MSVLLACFGLPLGMAGCFNAERENDEAAAVAEALTRSVSFFGGSLEDGPLPGADDDTVSLVPLESSVVLVPGSPNLMSLMPDNPEQADDPVDAVLVQFGVARKHIEVSVGERVVESDEGSSPVSLDFDVADDVCDTLCNKLFTVEVKQQLKLRSGKKGRAVSRTVQLECSGRGSSKYCADDGPRTSGSAGGLEKRLLDNLESCDLVAQPGSISVDRLPCVWECLAGLDCSTLRGALCEGSSEFSTQCAQSCADEVLAEFTCSDGVTIQALQECDGFEDCFDGGDERSCDTFSCDGVSYPEYFRCDLAMDCSDGSDEEGCVQLNCGGDAIEPGGGEGGGAAGSFGGAGGAMTAGTGGFGDAGSGADAGPRAGTGGGGAAGIGGAGGGAMPDPIGYGSPCEFDLDCPPEAPHCVAMPTGMVCSINCTGQCPMLPGNDFTPACGADGICGSMAGQ